MLLVTSCGKSHIDGDSYMKQLIIYMKMIVLLLVFLGSRPVLAQENAIVDTFSIGAGISLNTLDSKVRLDSTTSGTGTVIDYETDLGFAKSKFIPNVELQWMPWEQHKFFFAFTQYNRSQTAKVSEVIDFGDLVVPIDATVKGYLDIDEYKFGYMFYPLFRERWALGIGGGLRLLDVATGLKIVISPAGFTPLVKEDSAKTTGPLPFINLEYRYVITPKWRLIAGAGYFKAQIGSFKGEQALFGGSIEHLVLKHFSWGIMGDYSFVDVKSKKKDFTGKAKLDIGRVGLFAKFRW
jgi:hypothetical protein